MAKPHIYKVRGRWFVQMKVGQVRVLAPGEASIDHAWKNLQGRVQAHYRIRLPNSKMRRRVEFKDYVLDQLVVCGIYSKAHDYDAVKAVNDLVSWNVQVALDPRVSSDAAKLQNEAYRKAASLCFDKGYLFDIDILRNSTKSGVMAIMARRLGEEIEKCIVPLNER